MWELFQVTGSQSEDGLQKLAWQSIYGIRYGVGRPHQAQELL